MPAKTPGVKSSAEQLSSASTKLTHGLFCERLAEPLHPRPVAYFSLHCGERKRNNRSCVCREGAGGGEEELLGDEG